MTYSKVSIAYHDHSNNSVWNKSLLTCNSNKTDSSYLHLFPMKLHYMLSELEKDGLAHIVSWQVHGRCFLVHDQKQFVKDILPLWYRQSQFASFRRQLNLYGFRRVSAGRDKGAYFHEHFLRGQPALCCKIQRINGKSVAGRKTTLPPDFYSMPFLPTNKETNSEATALYPDQRIENLFMPQPNGNIPCSGSLSQNSEGISFQQQNREHKEESHHSHSAYYRQQVPIAKSIAIEPYKSASKTLLQKYEGNVNGGTALSCLLARDFSNSIAVLHTPAKNEKILADGAREKMASIPKENDALQTYQLILSTFGQQTGTTLPVNHTI